MAEFDPQRTPMEQRAADADHRARIAVDSAAAMLWMADAQRRYEWFSAACMAYTGRTADELRGDGWLGLVHLGDVERCSAVAAASFDAREAYTLDYRLLRRDGEYRWMIEQARPRFDASGALAGYTGSVVETPPRKQVEAHLAEELESLRLAERRQSVFLATLSHELRNPLAPIANAASMLRSLETGNPTLARLRQILERQVGRLGHLVEDLIDATRAAQGQISLATEQATVDTLVRNAVAASTDALNEAGHTLDVQMPDQHLAVRIDLSRMTEALAAIIGNAVRFTLQPGLISLEVRRSGSNNAEIAVRDPGIGISAEFLPHVFELFAQQHPALGRRPAGLGVGLTLARRIVQLHGGDIAAESQGPGTGARFVITLPLAGPETARNAPADPTPPAQSYRVLVIGSADDAREAMRLQMEMWGNEVRLAESASDGLRAAEAFGPHIVLCDVGAPDADGSELAVRLRAALPGRRIVIAALAAPGGRDNEAQALAAGYDFFLVKPVQPAGLMRLLRSRAEIAR